MRDPDRVTVSRKSQASSASACECRKSAQVVQARSGAVDYGLLEDSHTVEAATFTPSTSSSPCSRRYVRGRVKVGLAHTHLAVDSTRLVALYEPLDLFAVELPRSAWSLSGR
jgi:hypothetical protein